MLKEKTKTTVILLLIINLLFLTIHLWFIDSSGTIKNNFMKYVRQLPVIETFFPIEEEYSISKENLSKPRKFLVNDGSLWMAYYNTDLGFSPVNKRTKDLITGFLKGETAGSKKTDIETWEAGLESLSIYIEYPVAFSPEMFCRIMGVSESKAPKDVHAFREFIILPSSSEIDVCILARDSYDEDSVYAYILSDKYSLPASDLSIYTSNNEVYYQPVFSTGLTLSETSNVSLAPLVLFSDSQPVTKVLSPGIPMEENSKKKLLENFGFNADTDPYLDSDGAINYIANYATATIFPDGVFEYTSIRDDRGIILDESANSYNVLNASIDFAEKTWGCLSKGPLSILINSDLSEYDSSKSYTYKFDYYCNGRPVKIALPAQYGHERMNCAIEITVKNGKLISYRQYMRSYETVADYSLSDTFVTALDYFVQILEKEVKEPVILEDAYIGYLDTGNDYDLYATWLAKANNGKIYRYSAE